VSAEKRIRELGHELPSGSAPAANYVNAVRGGLPLVLKGVVELADSDGGPHEGA
jgi:hypothetical protein